MGKRLELLKELVPDLVKVGIVDPITPAGATTERYLEVIAQTAQGLGLKSQEFSFHLVQEIAPTFSAIAREGCQAALVIWNPLSFAHRREICAAAAESRLPTIYEARGFTTAGGLVSYGMAGFDLVHQLATYVDKILRGTKASELPVAQAVKFELVLNLGAAKALGLTLPASLLIRANEVIE